MFVGTMTSDCAARLTVTGARKALLDAQRDLQHKRKGVFNREPPPPPTEKPHSREEKGLAQGHIVPSWRKGVLAQVIKPFSSVLPCQVTVRKQQP